MFLTFFDYFFQFLNHALPSFFFFFNDTATTEIYPLSLHDALPISRPPRAGRVVKLPRASSGAALCALPAPSARVRSGCAPPAASSLAERRCWKSPISTSATTRAASASGSQAPEPAPSVAAGGAATERTGRP